MPIDPKRVEAAARARYERLFGLSFDGATDSNRAAHLEDMGIIAADLFPELASDPPTAWVAPGEMTVAIAQQFFDHGCVEGSLTEAWQAARDAHTKEQPEDANPTILHTGLVWARPHTKEQT